MYNLLTPNFYLMGFHMMLTIGKTAKAVGLSKTSIHKHIESGKLSATWNEKTNPRQREIDASEILRVYGVDITLPHSERKQVAQQNTMDNSGVDGVVKAKDETIAVLKQTLEDLRGQLAVKDEQIQNYSRLLAAPKTAASGAIPVPSPIRAAQDALANVQAVAQTQEPEPPNKSFWRRLVG